MIKRFFFTLAEGATLYPALLRGRFSASLFHPEMFQEVLVAWLDFWTGIKRREREELATGVEIGAQGIKGMLNSHMRTHTRTRSRLILLCFLDIPSFYSKKVVNLYIS